MTKIILFCKQTASRNFKILFFLLQNVFNFRLVVKVPWFNLWKDSTVIHLEGLHLLVVPSTSVQYDEKKELLEQFEAKQKRLQKAEEAKLLDLEDNEKKDDEKDEGYLKRLIAAIIKNLEVTITKVHIR